MLVYDDWRQDLLDFTKTVNDISLMKNRYSVLQNATYVANKIINEYNASSQGEDFYSFVMKKCEEMSFAEGDEKLIIDVTGEIAQLAKDGKKRDEIVDIIQERIPDVEIANRPQPEEMYPIAHTGDSEIDAFSDLAVVLAHKRLHHLNISEKEFEDVLKKSRKDYSSREWQSYYDFFTHTLQFGYLREKRFQRLYLILFLIAQGLSDGLSKDEIIHQIDSIFVVEEGSEREQEAIVKTAAERENDSEETIPFYRYSREEHRIIYVSSRVSRKLCDNAIFRKTVDLAIMIINKYHKVIPSMPERQYISFTTNSLKKENPRYAQAYDLIFRISESIFAGQGENETYSILLKGYLAPFLSVASQKANSITNKASEKKSIKDLARKELDRAIVECKMNSYTNECRDIVAQLHPSCPNTVTSKYAYFRSLQNSIDRHSYSGTSRSAASILSYILQCKLNDVPDASFCALVRTRFPHAYNH